MLEFDESAYSGSCVRVVEDQSRSATLDLVPAGDLDAQRLLEELLEEHKPPVPAGEQFEGLHFLLFTPFRYPPLRHGSRFGQRHERALFYAAEQLRSAFAEKAYYLLLFASQTEAKLEPHVSTCTSFEAAVKTRRCVDLSAPAYASMQRKLRSPTRYTFTQQLGSQLRAAGVELIRYVSARDPESGLNVALFEPVFARKQPSALRAWRCVNQSEGVAFQAKHSFSPEEYRFSVADFLVKGRLPSPAA